uniref:NADH dehydrogenase subunit 4L n=1 Tax=Oospira aenigmatica TaxID=1885787 RepID=A0A224A1H3_9EUPU|nr:NADH dehydrogenase subunit 4L [Oospira aenigmatica]
MLIFLQYLSVLLMVMTVLFFSTKNHYLTSILILEVITLLSLVISVSMCYMVKEGFNSFFLILTLLVCEAAFGLSILLSVVKTEGNDYILGYSMFK